MAMGRAEFVNGIVTVYDELGRKRTTKSCEKLVGYGPLGFVIRRYGHYVALTPDGVIVEQSVPERLFLTKKRWEWHDSYLRYMNN